MFKKRRRPFYAPHNLYYQKKQSFGHKAQAFFAIIIIITIVAMIYIQLDREVMPTVIAMAKLKGTSVATEAINEAVTQSLATHQITVEDLLSYDYNDAGELISWNVNSILINNLCADIVGNANEELQNIGEISFKVPLGNLTGSRIFANLGPDIGIKVLPVGTVKVDYFNDIQSTGINQVNHTVWLDVETTVQVVVPLFTEQVLVRRKLVLIDKMISGKVPPSYVNVPGQSILDVAPGDVTEDLMP